VLEEEEVLANVWRRWHTTRRSGRDVLLLQLVEVGRELNGAFEERIMSLRELTVVSGVLGIEGVSLLAGCNE
jgi:hypothetical protein